MLLLRKILCGILSAVSLLGSLVLTCMGLLAPLCPYTEELASKVDDDCAAFIEITCFFSILLLGISLAGLKFGKFDCLVVLPVFIGSLLLINCGGSEEKGDGSDESLEIDSGVIAADAGITENTDASIPATDAGIIENTDAGIAEDDAGIDDAGTEDEDIEFIGIPSGSPRTRTEEEWVISLLEDEGVLVHPGYFFDFPEEAFVTVSLLAAPDVFDEGIRRIAGHVAQSLS